MRVVVRVVVGTAAWGSAGRAAGTHRHTAHVSRDPRDTASDSASSLMLTPLASYYPERDSFFVNLFSSLRQNTQSPSAWALHILRGVPPPVPRAAAVGLRSAERTRSPPLEPTDTRTHGARHCLARHCSLVTVSRPSHANWQTNRFSPAAARPVAGRYKGAKRLEAKRRQGSPNLGARRVRTALWASRAAVVGHNECENRTSALRAVPLQRRHLDPADLVVAGVRHKQRAGVGANGDASWVLEVRRAAHAIRPHRAPRL